MKEHTIYQKNVKKKSNMKNSSSLVIKGTQKKRFNFQKAKSKNIILKNSLYW